MITWSQHGIVKPHKLFNLHTSTYNCISPLPTNPIDALHDRNWKMAIKEEYDALIENNVWDLVPRPSNANVIRILWIFKHMEKFHGSFERYKTHLVSNGMNQQSGVDCGETFSPIIKPTIIRMVLGISLSKSWCLYQLDVKMYSYTKIFMKLHVCTNLLDFAIQNTLSMCVYSRSLFMVSKKHCVHGVGPFGWIH